MRKVLLVSILCLSVSMFIGTASAFHDGGVAYCGGCHTMHNSQNGVHIDTVNVGGNDNLLRTANPTDLCLSCHAQTPGSTSTSGYKVWSANLLSPMAEQGGGDFCFLLEDNINDGHNGGQAANWIPGYKSGHSIVAPSKGAVADPTLTVGPGGNFPSSQLACINCHDPHGNENFRMLNGVGEIPGSYPYVFTNAAPNAEGIALSGAGNLESNSHHTAYKGGTSEWCANCHGDYHNYQGSDNYHPSGVAMGNESDHYNLYNGTAHWASGSQATAYLAAVPFEDASMTISSTAGPGNSSKVICMTCHRAHATSAPDAGRWDFNVTLLEEDGAESGSWAIPDPYSYAEQRSLCNKCHVKDAYDEGSSP